MFSARRRLPNNRAYNKTFLEKLASDLTEAGFNSITIKLPHNIVGVEKNEISITDFLTRERNYPSIIFSAYSTKRKETIKILFVNISTKAFFVDDTFPSGHSEPPEIFIQSPDPARVYALSGFFISYFNKEGKRTSSIFSTILFFASIEIVTIQFILFFGTGKGFFGTQYPSSPYKWVFDIAVCLVALFILFRMFDTPKGLYINERPRRNFWSLANMALKGQLMDNPLVALIITVIGGIITAYILRLLNLL